jgi:phosphomannomutase/phosphoglucomutase
MVINDNSVSGSEILSLIKNDQTLNDSSVGNIIYSDIKEIYISEILKNIDTDISELKVVIDSGNGAAGFIAPELFKRLGCDVIELYSEVDGNFPNHHPDPGKLENLEDIISEVKNKNADIGFAFDGDGDRVGLITNLGDMIFPDKQMMLFSEDILKNKKGPIVFDVKCSNHLTNLILKNGGTPIMAPTGHFHIKKAIKKNNALLGGEMSGHIFFNDKWYGFDDGPYAAVRAAEILAKSDRSISDIFNKYPDSFSTPELNISVTDENKFEIIEKFISECELDGEKITIDGLRVNYKNGWGLLRASNTTPKLVLRFEGDSIDDMRNIQDKFRSELSRICPEIDINLD